MKYEEYTYRNDFRGGPILLNANIVSTVLKEGTIIRTKVGNSPAWYQNIVFKCEDDTVNIALIESYIENIIMLGTNISLKCANEYFEYLFEGVVSGINPEYPSSVTVHVTKASEMINTRTFPRYDVYLASNIKPLWDDSFHFAIVTNICLGGMAFLLKHQFDYGEDLDISVFIPENSQSVCAKGRIIRRSIKTNFIDYSMQFNEMDEQNSIILSNYLTTLEENWITVQNDFFDNIKKYL